jgi:alanine racemase
MEKIKRAARVEIDLGALQKNFEAIRALAGDAAVVCSVKADAYGHGAVRASRALADAGADGFGIATIDEAAELREAGITKPIVMYGVCPRGAANDALELGILTVVTTYEDAKLLSEAAARRNEASPAEVILSVDTGMGRIGFLDNEDGAAQIARIAALPNIALSGIASHFATSDEEDTAYTREQIDRFNSFYAQLENTGLRPRIRSIANSAAIARFPEARFAAVRPGIALYGASPSDSVDSGVLPLAPAMSVKANLVYIKKAPAGCSISYGRRFRTERESLIATLPLGYADGLPRNLSGSGRVIIRGRYAPIVGSICMDQCMVDVTDIPGVCEYDEAVILGAAGDLRITADELAGKCGTISYEILCRFGQQRLTRVYLP